MIHPGSASSRTSVQAAWGPPRPLELPFAPAACQAEGPPSPIWPLFYRNLPDVTARDFERVDLSQYKWIHFEVSPRLGGFQDLGDPQRWGKSLGL